MLLYYILVAPKLPLNTLNKDGEEEPKDELGKSIKYYRISAIIIHTCSSALTETTIERVE